MVSLRILAFMIERTGSFLRLGTHTTVPSGGKGLETSSWSCALRGGEPTTDVMKRTQRSGSYALAVEEEDSAAEEAVAEDDAEAEEAREPSTLEPPTTERRRRAEKAGTAADAGKGAAADDEDDDEAATGDAGVGGGFRMSASADCEKFSKAGVFCCA